MNPQTQAWSDQYDAHVTATIRRFGWSIQYVGGGICSRPGCTCEGDDGPPFAYTVGMFGLNHPELLIFDVDPETALAVLNEVSGRVLEGDSFLPGMTLELDDWDRSILAEAVPNPGDIVFVANDYYRRPAEVSVPVIQLTYPDDEGRFPWDPGCTSNQPRPGEFSAWSR
jgi:hypothetical protein